MTVSICIYGYFHPKYSAQFCAHITYIGQRNIVEEKNGDSILRKIIQEKDIGIKITTDINSNEELRIRW